MRKIILLSVCVLALLVSVGYGRESKLLVLDPDSFVQFGMPEGTPKSNQTVRRVIYTLSNNQQTKFADWVAYRLNKKSVTGPSKKERKWKRDPALPEGVTLEPKDYDDAFKVLRTERGHQAPLASFKGTAYWRLTNYLSNITPQYQNLNEGPWARLEDAVRRLAATETVYVMTGPLYEREMPKLPKATKEHRIPSGYWKIVGIRNPNKGLNQPPLHVVGFIFDQETPKNEDYRKHSVTINEIEEHSGLNFFPDLPDGIEERMESVNTLTLQ